ncbi:MAG TPA: DUF2277 domain-containing protein [Promineifilum sp.]|nr:DUF2277 domain-containing protein [Promineifilum sp.]
MCRNIKKLRTPEQPPTDEEIALAALQFVRKVSGYRKPSRANQAAFDSAVLEIAAATRRMLEELTPVRSADTPG